MKAVILAAGRGTRIEAATQGTPKCLLEFGGKPILKRQAESLLAAGVSRIAVVVGHRRDRIVQAVNGFPKAIRESIDFIDNLDYAVTNNIYSLWMAKTWLSGDGFVCLNADILFDPEILKEGINLKTPVSMIIDRELREETMKVVIKEGLVVEMKKGISYHRASGTYIGITVFAESITPAFFNTMSDIISEGRVDVFFNVAVERLAQAGTEVSFTETGGLPWAEIDDPADLMFARSCVYSRFSDCPADGSSDTMELPPHQLVA